MRVLILKADRFYAEALKCAVLLALPTAQIEIANRVTDAIARAAEAPLDLVITGISLLDGDVLGFLSMAFVAGGNIGRVLIVTGRKEPRALAKLRESRVSGVFDSSTEGLEALQTAVAIVAEGGGYWSQSIIDRIYGHKAGHLYRNLTPSEQRVFAEIGDGSDDKDAAQRLGMTATSVHGVRRRLHRKLGINHRGDLIRFAMFLGFVRFAHDNMQRSGDAAAKPPGSSIASAA